MRDLARGPELEDRLAPPKAGERPAERPLEAGTATPPARRATGAAAVLGLQRSVGNAATTRYLQREGEEDGHDHAAHEHASPVHEAIGRSGSPLDASIRSTMEPLLQTSLSDVQVVPDRASTASVGASAYTVGNKVVVNPDRVQSGTPQAQRTFFHEVAHVKQQREGPVAGTPQAGGIQVSHPEDRFEQEAERTADQAMGLQRQTSSQAAAAGEQLADAPADFSAPAVQRLGAEEDEEEE